MFVSFKFNKRSLLLVLGAVLAVVALMVTDFILSQGETTAAVQPEASANSDAERIAFLATCGWSVNPEPLEVQEVLIPLQFDDVYKTYNAIQLDQGFDLTAYCGKRVKRWTYSVTDYPSNIQGVRANLLVYDGQVIGGDICTIALDGFMHGLRRADAPTVSPSLIGRSSSVPVASSSVLSSGLLASASS